MTTPIERLEILALPLVAKGAGTYPLSGCDGVHEAVVNFPPNDPGAVTVTFRTDGKPVGEVRFDLAIPAPVAPAPLPPPKEKQPTRAERAENALPALRQAVAERPGDADAWHELGSALFAARKFEAAVEALEKAVELEPGSLCTQFDLGVAHGELGRHADAEKWFGGIVALDPNLQLSHSHVGVVSIQNLATARLKQGRPVEALETLKSAVPLAWKILFELGAYAMDAGRHAEAIRYFSAAVTLDPDDGDLLHGLGRSLLHLGRNEEAESYLRSSIRQGRKDVHAAYDLGLALARQGKRAEARHALRAALKADAKHAWSWYDLGCLDALDGRPDEAFRKLRRAARLGMNNVGHAEADPDLARLRKDRRWAGLVAEMRGEQTA